MPKPFAVLLRNKAGGFGTKEKKILSIFQRIVPKPFAVLLHNKAGGFGTKGSKILRIFE